MAGCQAYPRLQQLLADLAGAEAVIRESDYYFRTPAGHELRLDELECEHSRSGLVPQDEGVVLVRARVRGEQQTRA